MKLPEMQAVRLDDDALEAGRVCLLQNLKEISPEQRLASGETHIGCQKRRSFKSSIARSVLIASCQRVFQWSHVMQPAWQFSVSLMCADNGRIVEGKSLVDTLLPSHTRDRYKPEKDIMYCACQSGNSSETRCPRPTCFIVPLAISSCREFRTSTCIGKKLRIGSRHSDCISHVCSNRVRRRKPRT